ncbi:MAG: HypC/HybG/HupF family hydrogenase formation chaperone [Verrucomicrobiota bacterium]|nr:HypC/HybG/HupF family hydrogenase formation chaperone [Verrucomicrobiota bacterium]
MNLVYGEIVEILTEDGAQFGKIRVHGAIKKIPTGLLTDAAKGDTVLICEGVAISRVGPQSEREKNNVSGNSWETH